MTSRERVRAVISHRTPDRTPVDLGGSPVTGISASALAKLRAAFGLKGPVRVDEPFQMLGRVEDDLREVIGIDTAPLASPYNFFGYTNDGWKPWRLFDGTRVLVPGKFNTREEPDGSILMYPCGDTTVPPSGRMPKGGYYFDAIVRQPPLDESRLDPRDNVDIMPISDELLEYYNRESERLYRTTDYSIFANFGWTSFGDIAVVPGPSIKQPKGIRDIEEWYISTVVRRPYIRQVFEIQCEIALANLEKVREAVGNRVDVIFVSGTDFGTQNSQFISGTTYRELYMPFHKKVNDWVHSHTTWKTFIHTCGAVEPLIPLFIEAGFDILNPVQISASGMSPELLKKKYGHAIAFWGGGIDTQKTLPFGSPQEIMDETKRNLSIFGSDTGYVFNTVHNIQARTPVENILAMFQAVKEFNDGFEKDPSQKNS
jgi:hypothetical protein